MPESFDQQPSFTSSTYQVIASDVPLTPNSDRPLSEQPGIQTFLNDCSTGPIPEIVLYRLLTIAELYLRQHFPDKQLSGLCIGYFFQSEGQSELYHVSWGWISEYEAAIEKARHTPSHASTIGESLAVDGGFLDDEDMDVSLQFASDEDVELEKLACLIEEELNQQAKENLRTNQQIKALLLSHFSPAQRSGEYLFSVPLESPSELSFETADNTVSIPLNRDIELNSEVSLNVTRENFGYSRTQTTVFSTQSCHSHTQEDSEGNERQVGRFRFGDPSRDHTKCKRC